MNCSDIRNHCHPYLDKQLDAAKSQEVDTHLSACPCCEQAYEAERAFLSVLKKLTQNCGCVAPANLRGRITESLTTPTTHVEFKALPKPLALPRVGWLIGMAASIMLGFGALLGYQMLCVNGMCPIMIAAEQEHEKIVSGAHSFLAKNSDPKVLTEAIQKELPEFSSLPNLAKYDLTPIQCGLVTLANLPQGVFVEFTGPGGGEPLTLMMVKTESSSKAPVVAEKKSAKYHLAIREQHTVCSWHCQKSGLLYVLVSRRQQGDSLEIAEVASN